MDDAFYRELAKKLDDKTRDTYDHPSPDSGDDDDETCPECDGSGEIVMLRAIVACERCDGSGRIDGGTDDE
jgi:DnaJ-class molecular chaperone